MNPKGYILYRIWYGDNLVYLGRTKQPLQSRIHGHLFKKHMHRSINIDLVTKIEYAEFQSESDMNLYEIYFINLWKPTLNIDDKCKDDLSIRLPEVEWKIFVTHLWDKWKKEINTIDDAYKMKRNEKTAKAEIDRLMRKKWHDGEITEDAYYNYLEKSRQRSIESNMTIDDILGC